MSLGFCDDSGGSTPLANSGSIVIPGGKKRRAPCREVTIVTSWRAVIQDSEFCHTCHLFPGPETQQNTRGQTQLTLWLCHPSPVGAWTHSTAPDSVFSTVKWNKTTPWEGCCDNEMRSWKTDNAVSGRKLAHNKLVALIIITNCYTADLKDKYRIEIGRQQEGQAEREGTFQGWWFDCSPKAS